LHLWIQDSDEKILVEKEQECRTRTPPPLNSLVKVSARVPDITCITQVTLKMINNALLIHKGWLMCSLTLISSFDLSTCVHMADSCIDLLTEVCKLSAYCICRFLVLEEHKGTAIGNHLKDQHNMSPNGIAQNFKILGSASTNLIALFLKCFLSKN